MSASTGNSNEHLFRLESKLDRLLEGVAKGEAVMHSLSLQYTNLASEQKEQDRRLRKLETSVAKLVAYASLFSAGGSAAMTFVLQKVAG